MDYIAKIGTAPYNSAKADYTGLFQEQKQLRDGGTDLMALRDQLKKKKGYEG